MDTVGDFLTVIRNGVKAGHEKVDVPNSKQKEAIAEVLRKTDYISSFKVVKDGKQGVMRVYLNYNSDGTSKINGIRRMSRPGRRCGRSCCRHGVAITIMDIRRPQASQSGCDTPRQHQHIQPECDVRQ